MGDDSPVAAGEALMKNDGVAKRHDVENVTVLVTNLEAEKECAELIFLRGSVEYDADAFQDIVLGRVETGEGDGHFGGTVFAVALEVEVVHRHAAITRKPAPVCAKEKPPEGA